MGKRYSAQRGRHAARKKRNNRLVTGAMGLAIIGLVAVLIWSSSGEAAPTVPADRLALDPVLGDPEAPVTLIEYGAYGCPACQSWHQAGVVEQLLAEYPGQVRFIYRDYPVIAPSYSRMAAKAAQCALDQGNDAFWTYHDALFTFSGPGASEGDLIRLAGTAGLDEAAFRTCVENNTHQATVEHDEAQGRNLALRGTPSFVVNGRLVYNASPDALRQAIEAALNS